MVFEPPAPFDAGPSRDGGVVDGGASCRFGDFTCAPGEFCNEVGACVPRDVGCRFSTQCAQGDVCLRPLVASSTITPGNCSTPPGACSSDADCPDGHCLGVGVCGPRADRFVANGGAPQLVTACDDQRTCGPTSVCRNGECGACQVDADCPRRLVCEDGVCEDQASCLSDLECYEGSVCGASATCERIVDDCTPDPFDDDSFSANPIDAASYEGLTICGDDVDWYEVELPHLFGAFVTVTATSSYATLAVEIEEPSELSLPIRRLELPGVVAFSVPQLVLDDPDATTFLRFGVTTREANARYRIDVRLDRRGCGDVLDLYGDDESPPLAPPNVPFERVGCPGEIDRVDIDTLVDDRVTVSGTWSSPAMDVDFFLYDAAGARIATTGTVASTSEESVTSVPLTASGRVRVEANPRRAPTAGEVYSMTVLRDLGSRDAVCANPDDLVLSNGMATVTGSFTGGANLGRPECPADPQCIGDAICDRYSEFGRRDVLYRIQPPSAPSIFVASVAPLGNTPVRMSLALLSTCDDDTTDLVCNAAGLVRRPTSIERVLDSTTPIYLMVSSDGVAEDFDFELQVNVDPIAMPANDTCFDAVDLPATDSRLVSTFGAANDDQLRETNACGPAGRGAGPDRFYRMTLTANERAALELTGPQGGFLWSGLSCTAMTETCTTADSIATDFTSPVATTTFRPGRDQTFYVAVDGLNRDVTGRYTLRTIREPELECLLDTDCASPLRCDDYRCRPVPAADTCPGAPLTLVDGYVRITGSTGAANDNASVSCGAAGAPDVVYAVAVPPGFGNIAFRVTEARFDPILAVRRDRCDVDPNEWCVDDVRFPDILLPEVQIEAPVAGTYYVIVDAFAGEGPFTLEIEATP